MSGDTPGYLQQEAAALAAVRTGAVAHRPGGPAPSMGSLEDIDPSLGRYGGVTIKEVRTQGIKYPPGVFLPPALVLSWPLPNRAALETTKRVSYFRSPPPPEVIGPLMAKDAARAMELLG